MIDANVIKFEENRYHVNSFSHYRVTKYLRKIRISKKKVKSLRLQVIIALKSMDLQRTYWLTKGEIPEMIISKALKYSHLNIFDLKRTERETSMTERSISLNSKITFDLITSAKTQQNLLNEMDLCSPLQMKSWAATKRHDWWDRYKTSTSCDSTIVIVTFPVSVSIFTTMIYLWICKWWFIPYFFLNSRMNLK